RLRRSSGRTADRLPLPTGARPGVYRRSALDRELGRLLGSERHRRGARFVVKDRLDGVDPARVAVIGLPEPVLAAPEQDRGKSGVLEVLENAADRLRAGALGVGIAEVRRLPRFRLRLRDPGLLPLLVGQVADAREPVRPVAIGVTHVV